MQSELGSTGIPGLFKKLWKKAWAKKNGQCSYCQPHRGENAGRKPRHKSWKAVSRRQKQFAALND